MKDVLDWSPLVARLVVMNTGMWKNSLIVCSSLVAVVLCGCGVEKSTTEKLEVDDLPLVAPAIDEITLEEGADGLMVEVGKDKAFSGVDIEPEEEPDGEGGTKDFIVETPYSKGVIDGVKRTYFSGGAIRENRTYKKGVPVQVETYYSDGSKKFSGQLNSEDRVEGATQRLAKDGTVLGEGSYDANEKHHGVWKEYDESGERVGEYLWDHGKIKKIIFETPEQIERRLHHYGEVEPSVEMDAPNSDA